MKKSFKQALSLLLVAAMLIACIPSVLAAEDQTSGTVPVAITASTPTFSVTVPTTLPIYMDAYGDVTCGDITITNNSAGPVQVEDTQLTALNGWALVDYDTTTFLDTDKGQHRVALQLDRDNGVTAAGADIGEDFIPAGGGQQTVSVSVKLPYQGVEMADATIAQVVFVLGWYKYTVPLTGLTITGPDTVTVGGAIQLTAAKLPPNTTNEGTIKWSSSNTSVATVNSDGLVTGVSIGTATITASCEGVTATKTIYVTKPSSVNGVKLFLSNSGYDCLSAGPQDAENVTGDIYSTTFQVTTTNAHDHDHNVSVEIPHIDGWKVSNVSALFKGTFSDYYLQLGDNGGIWSNYLYYGMGYPLLGNRTFSVTVSFTLTKSDDIYLRGLEILGGSTMKMEETNQLTVKKLPENTTDTSDIVWSSSNTDVASVNDSGVVTSKKAGDTIITATCGGQSATKVIKVRQIFQLEVINGYTGTVDTTITPIKEGDSYVANFKGEAFEMGGYATKLRVNPVYGPESNLDGYAWEMKVTVPDGEVFSFSGNGRSEWPDEFSLGVYNSGEVEVAFRATPS